MKYSTVQYSKVQYSRQHSTVQYPSGIVFMVALVVPCCSDEQPLHTPVIVTNDVHVTALLTPFCSCSCSCSCFRFRSSGGHTRTQTSRQAAPIPTPTPFTPTQIRGRGGKGGAWTRSRCGWTTTSRISLSVLCTIVPAYQWDLLL
jgi:hypothetical protein